MRWARMGKGHRTGSRGVRGHSLDDACVRNGAREIDPHACQCSGCPGLHWKSRNRVTRDVREIESSEPADNRSRRYENGYAFAVAVGVACKG